MKHLVLLRAERRHRRHRLAAVQAHTVMLDALQFLERPLGRVTRVGRLESAAHHPVQDPLGGSPLVAKKGHVRVHHFAHRGASCTTGAETALHRMAKQIVADERRLVEPGRDTPTVFRDAALPDEMCWPGRRPDVVLWSESMTVHVEVTVTHRCGPEKLEEIVRKGIPTIELDLSTAYRRKRLGWTIEQLTDRVAHEPGIRRWLHQPERAMEPAQPTSVREPQTPNKTPVPIGRAPSSRIYAPFDGTLLVFEPRLFGSSRSYSPRTAM